MSIVVLLQPSVNTQSRWGTSIKHPYPVLSIKKHMIYKQHTNNYNIAYYFSGGGCNENKPNFGNKAQLSKKDSI